ncbi:6311_t:CDS:2 [Entrophospora sp. SA101]|nr:6311_t:CDS:2 [Entrophospora sp. SA101]
MDDTFKTVPTLFRQLYTIHTCVGDLIDFSNEQDIHLQPQFILTDFEQAAINASCIKFPSAQNKGCLFHLAQSVYCKIQATAFDWLKDEIPTEAVGVVQWFEDNYVHGRARRALRNGTIVQDTPMFPPRLWSVANNVEYALPHTTNSVEAWHRRWEERPFWEHKN